MGKAKTKKLWKRIVSFTLAVTMVISGLVIVPNNQSTVQAEEGTEGGGEVTPPPTAVYKVSFDSNEGSAVALQEVADGKKATKPAEPTRAGFKFVGWYIGEEEYDFNTAVTGDITLTAVWEKVPAEGEDLGNPNPGNTDPEQPAKARGVSYNEESKTLRFFVEDADKAVTEVKLAFQTYATKEEAEERAKDKTHTDMPGYPLTRNEETGVWEYVWSNYSPNHSQPYVLYSFYFAGGSEAGIGEWTMTNFTDLKDTTETPNPEPGQPEPGQPEPGQPGQLDPGQRAQTRGISYNEASKTLRFFVEDADKAVTEVKLAFQTYATKEEAEERAKDKTHTDMPGYPLTRNEETGVWEYVWSNYSPNQSQPYVLYSFYFAGGSEAGIGEWTMTNFTDLKDTTETPNPEPGQPGPGQPGQIDPGQRAQTRGISYNEASKTLRFFVEDADKAVTAVKLAFKTYATKEEAEERVKDKTHTNIDCYPLTWNEETGVWEYVWSKYSQNKGQPYVIYSFYFEGGSEAGIGEWEIANFTDLIEIIPVTGITLDKDTLTLEEEATATLKATVTPIDATDKTVTWKTSDDTIAKVSSSGKVTAVKEGTATITAITTDGKFDASCEVTVTEKIILAESVTLDKTSLTLEVGASDSLRATVSPSDAKDKTITWKSDTPDVVTVDDEGNVKAEKAGTAKITVITTNGKTATCSVTVKVSVSDISLNKTSTTLKVGETETLTETVAPKNATNKNVTWESSDDSIAKVVNGVITAVKKGEATITVTTIDGSKTAICTVTVEEVNVDAVTLDETSLSLLEGEEATLTATVVPENATNQNVNWESDDELVAKVKNGVVTALKEGTATITVTTENGLTATCSVTVSKPEPEEIEVESVELDQTTLELIEGEEVTLTATVSPNSATYDTVEWSTSKPDVATVDNKGVVRAEGDGNATITATVNGKSATCEVTVKAKVVAVTGIVLSDDTLNLIIGETATLTATVSPNDASDKTVTWEPSDPDVVMVENGVVTAVGEGEATIKAKAGDEEAICTVTVTAEETEDDGNRDDVNQDDGKQDDDNKENVTVSVNGVSLTDDAVSLNVGETYNLTATITPDDATIKNVTWKPSDETIAKVDENGKVTAIKAGTVTITVTTEDGNFTASCTVTVTEKTKPEESKPDKEEDVTKVTGVAINKTAFSLVEGGTETLTATVNPSTAVNKQVVWTIDKPEVANVDFMTGKVIAVKAGTATITVTTVDGGKTASCTVTVTAAPIVTTPAPEGSKTEAEADKIVTSTNTDKKDIAGSSFIKFQLKATGMNKQVKLTWKKVSGADGYIVYGAQSGKSLEKLTTTTKKNYTHKKLQKGKYYKYVVVAYKIVDGQKYIIETSTSVNAATTGTQFGNPAKITVKPAKATVNKGKTKKLEANFTTQAKKVTTHIAKFRYESSNPAVAKVNKKGEVKGVSKGKATIYVYTQNGICKKVNITVK